MPDVEKQIGYQYKSSVSNRPLLDFPRPDGKVHIGILTYLDLLFPDLQGKRILDVAGGRGQALEDAVKMGLDWHYIDPLLLLPVHNNLKIQIRQLLEQPEFEGRIKTGVASQLPYEDKSFDVVVSAVGVPLVCQSPKDVEMSMQEMIRVAKERVIFNVLGSEEQDSELGIDAFNANRTIYGQGSGSNQFPVFGLKNYLESLVHQRQLRSFVAYPLGFIKRIGVVKLNV